MIAQGGRPERRALPRRRAQPPYNARNRSVPDLAHDLLANGPFRTT